jgi:aminopeptidase-like protein
VFNDPLIGIPGLLVSRWPYKEYHTDQDTPDKIDYTKVVETGDLIQKIIEIYEKDYIPERLWKGPLMRSRYGFQSPVKFVNLNWDYLFYNLGDGRTVAELCADFEISFDEVWNILEKIISDGKLKRLSLDSGEGQKLAAARKK